MTSRIESSPRKSFSQEEIQNAGTLGILPDEIIGRIFSFLDAKTLQNLTETSKYLSWITINETRKNTYAQIALLIQNIQLNTGSLFPDEKAFSDLLDFQSSAQQELARVQRPSVLSLSSLESDIVHMKMHILDQLDNKNLPIQLEISTTPACESIVRLVAIWQRFQGHKNKNDLHSKNFMVNTIGFFREGDMTRYQQAMSLIGGRSDPDGSWRRLPRAYIQILEKVASILLRPVLFPSEGSYLYHEGCVSSIQGLIDTFQDEFLRDQTLRTLALQSATEPTILVAEDFINTIPDARRDQYRVEICGELARDKHLSCCKRIVLAISDVELRDQILQEVAVNLKYSKEDLIWVQEFALAISDPRRREAALQGNAYLFG